MIGMLLVLSFTTVFIMFFSARYYAKMVKALDDVKNTQVVQYEDHVETRQFLMSTIDWETKRQKLILFMRDVIINEWGRCGRDLDYNKAYLIAEADMVESEKYPHIDPLFLLAMQWKESSFIDTIKSSMGAVGLMQIMPATGRLLAGFFGMQYSDLILKNMRTSIRFGAKYIDVLYAQYGNMEVVLAAYNGGFWQAHYYQSEKDKLAAETSAYIPTIMSKMEEYKEGLKSYRLDEVMKVK